VKTKPSASPTKSETARAPRANEDRQQYEQAYELRLALREFLAATEQVTRKHGLTSERYQLLLFIEAATQRGADPTVSDLAAAYKLAPSSATQLVRRAENLRLIRRELADNDARIRYLRLTDEGRRRLANAVAELGEERARLVALIST
jgi:DNA-binding MarR family transcriptional regulator